MPPPPPPPTHPLATHQVVSTDGACQRLKAGEEALRMEVVGAVNQRYSLLLATARAQRTGKRLEEMEAGK